MKEDPVHPAAGKAVVYVRLSGQPYGYDPFSPGNQRRICRDHALREHIEIVAEYQDLAISGRKDEADRPGFEASMELIRRKAVEILYVAKLDRLSRRGLEHVGTLLDEIDRVGGRVVFVADGLDTRQPAVRQTIAMLAEQARAEADAATWRLSEWRAHNRRNGLWKRIRPFGYIVSDGKLSPHPTEAPIVRGMVDSYLAGSSTPASSVATSTANRFSQATASSASRSALRSSLSSGVAPSLAMLVNRGEGRLRRYGNQNISSQGSGDAESAARLSSASGRLVAASTIDAQVRGADRHVAER
jgi:DNA invertase Pin-like site-specific DNA recombinase